MSLLRAKFNRGGANYSCGQNCSDRRLERQIIIDRKPVLVLPEALVTEKTKAPTKVFISYSWDSDEHKERVLALANTLRDPWGIETDIDQYVRAKPLYTPEQGWDLWMQKRIEWAEFVLIVCTETYKRRFRGYVIAKVNLASV